MKALTLTQPWASLVASGAKRIETRSWRTAYRGPLAIHAAAGFPESARDLCHRHPFGAALASAGIGYAADLPRGSVVATCRLVACIPTNGIQHNCLLVYPRCEIVLDETERAFGEYAPGRWAWLLADIKRMDAPIPAKGSLSLWDWIEPSTAGETPKNRQFDHLKNKWIESCP